MFKFLIPLALLIATSCQTHINESISKDVESRMQNFMANKKISGAVTLAYHRGNIIHHQATGFANIATQEKMTTESLFRIASLTKNVTAISVMILQDRGKLSVNDKVSKYIPEYANLKVKGSNQTADLRIRHLMSHTSGIVLPRNDGSMSLQDDALAGAS